MEYILMSEKSYGVLEQVDDVIPRLWAVEVTFQIPNVDEIPEEDEDAVIATCVDLGLLAGYGMCNTDNEIYLSLILRNTFRKAAYEGYELALFIFESSGISEMTLKSVQLSDTTEPDPYTLPVKCEDIKDYGEIVIRALRAEANYEKDFPHYTDLTETVRDIYDI